MSSEVFTEEDAASYVKKVPFVELLPRPNNHGGRPTVIHSLLKI